MCCSTWSFQGAVLFAYKPNSWLASNVAEVSVKIRSKRIRELNIFDLAHMLRQNSSHLVLAKVNGLPNGDALAGQLRGHARCRHEVWKSTLQSSFVF